MDVPSDMQWLREGFSNIGCGAIGIDLWTSTGEAEAANKVKFLVFT